VTTATLTKTKSTGKNFSAQHIHMTHINQEAASIRVDNSHFSTHLRTHATVADAFPASVVANAWSNCGRTGTGGRGKGLESQATSRTNSLMHLNSFPPTWQSHNCFDLAAASIKAQAPEAEMPHE
jgi:hypothetical protein